MQLQVSNHEETEKETSRSPDLLADPFAIQTLSKALPFLPGSSKHPIWLLLSQFHLEIIPS